MQQSRLNSYLGSNWIEGVLVVLVYWTSMLLSADIVLSVAFQIGPQQGKKPVAIVLLWCLFVVLFIFFPCTSEAFNCIATLALVVSLLSRALYITHRSLKWYGVRLFVCLSWCSECIQIVCLFFTVQWSTRCCLKSTHKLTNDSIRNWNYQEVPFFKYKKFKREKKTKKIYICCVVFN